MKDNQTHFGWVKSLIITVILVFLVYFSATSILDARMSAKTEKCRRNLARLYQVQRSIEMEWKRNWNVPITNLEHTILMRNPYLKTRCPFGGAYEFGRFGMKPQCFFPGHTF